jgi:hypothetical protein
MKSTDYVVHPILESDEARAAQNSKFDLEYRSAPCKSPWILCSRPTNIPEGVLSLSLGAGERHQPHTV